MNFLKKYIYINMYIYKMKYESTLAIIVTAFGQGCRCTNTAGSSGGMSEYS